MKDGCPDQLTHQFLTTLDKMAEERQEPCIHCGNVWYTIHHKDGVCHDCQKKRKPGRIVLERRRKVLGRIMFFGSLILLIVVIVCFGYFLS